MSFLVEAARRERRGVLYAFEESVDSVLARSRGIRLPVDEMLADGALKIVRVNPMQLYPDEFLSMVRAAVEEDGCRLIVIDSLRGYDLAMGEFGTPVAHLHNLVTYLGSREVTTLLLNEVEYITGDLRATELGVSHLADNIILMRYVEHESQVIKVIGCLKKRLGASSRSCGNCGSRPKASV